MRRGTPLQGRDTQIQPRSGDSRQQSEDFKYGKSKEPGGRSRHNLGNHHVTHQLPVHRLGSLVDPGAPRGYYVSAVNGSTLTVSKPKGRTITVVTSAQTQYVAPPKIQAALSSIAVGTRLIVRGPMTGTTITAVNIRILPAACSLTQP